MKFKTIKGLLASAACVAAAAFLAMPSAGVAAPDASAPLAFDIYPADVNLLTSRDEQSVVVRTTDADGVSHDITNKVEFSFSDSKIARVENNVVKPLADGETKLTVTYNGKSVSVPVKVKDGGKDRDISFKLDVMPVFLAAGCNAGGCHGAARGKDGFRLSLFGYNPDGDYHYLTREQPGRRMNLALPEESLMLTKATGEVAHTGGKRFERDSRHYKTLLRWLDSGAPADSASVPVVTSVEMYPPRMVMEADGATQQVTVRAKYADGSDRDVTHLALFLSSNDSSAALNEAGLIKTGQRGEAFVMARFDTHTVGAQVIVVPPKEKFTFPTLHENNYVDTLVNNKLRDLRMLPSELCSDEVFARRVYVDVVGGLPTSEELAKFVADADPKKRENLVDELLGRKEFVEMWVMKWAELLQIRTDNQNQGLSQKGGFEYYNWLQDKIARNVPFDQIVQELISANGGTFTNPAVNYYQVERDTLKIAENTAQVFMGMRIQCAQCHNHPFDRWTQNDYYGFASFFTQIARKRGEDMREVVVVNSGGGETNHPVTGKPVPPTFLGGGPADVQGKDRREVLAKWIASPRNPWFAKNLANVVWAHFFGVGIIDQVDDVRISNPASNPEFLDELAKRFTEYRYDFKRLVRDVCTSRTYQLATQTNPTNELDSRNFAHAAIRRIRAEVLLDCISQVTDAGEKFQRLPQGARAVQIPDGQTSNYFLTTFGRASRETACSCEVIMEPNLSQALHLLNGQTVQQKITNGGLVRKMMEAKKSETEIIEDLYLRCVSRKPTDKEMSKFSELLDEAKQPQDKRKVLEDIFWALLNSQEFIFNH